ncbi:MAG TPA: hypothetical protein VGS96_09205 [Thermoanaerobaculia bacterium]|jgi:hypothetical protein|nr:hypothetical protein [Thermoanaerobaculia bacterium]
MATKQHTTEGASRRRGKTSLAETGLSTTAILDIVDRLGLVDLIVDRLKARLDDVDTDQIIDEIADYLKKNPEVLVVALGAVTIASGALVYLNRRK